MTPEQFAYWTFWRPSHPLRPLVFEDFDNDPQLSALPDLPWPVEAQPDPWIVLDEATTIPPSQAERHLPDACPGSIGEPCPTCETLDVTLATKMSTELGRALEDNVVATLAGWDDIRKATAYEILAREGMTRERAHQIRVKAGLSD